MMICLSDTGLSVTHSSLDECEQHYQPRITALLLTVDFSQRGSSIVWNYITGCSENINEFILNLENVRILIQVKIRAVKEDIVTLALHSRTVIIYPYLSLV